MNQVVEAINVFLENSPELLESAQKINYLNAKSSPLLEKLESSAEVSCMQTFRPFYLQLSALNKDVSPNLNKQADLSVIELSKQKEESLWLVGLAAENTKPGGTIVAAGSNDTGAKSFHKKLKKEFNVESDSFSKKKCRVLLINRDSIDESSITSLIGAGDAKPIEDCSLLGSPSGFSSKKVDKGSALLAGFFDSIDMKGKGGDFGSGYGYLSWQILSSGIQPKSIELLEADYRSSECSKENLKELKEKSDLIFSWKDMLSEPPESELDWIVMNPPFHLGEKTQTGLGQKCIKAASKALKRKGELLMVANRSLPYEEILADAFFKFEQLTEAEGYKVVRAIK